MVFTIFYHQIGGETWWNMVKPVNFPQNQVSPSRQKDSPTVFATPPWCPPLDQVSDSR